MHFNAHLDNSNITRLRNGSLAEPVCYGLEFI